MRIDIGGMRMFFDVEGAKLRPDGPQMREVPTVVLLHGGPGGDHSAFKPHYGKLADLAQVVYIDHRGHGRSDPVKSRAIRTLRQRRPWNRRRRARALLRSPARIHRGVRVPARNGRRRSVTAPTRPYRYSSPPGGADEPARPGRMGSSNRCAALSAPRDTE